MLRCYHYPMSSPPIRQPIRILGIDPGLRRTGWGVIEIEGNRLIYLGCGSVEPPDTLPLASRLLAIHEGLAAVLGDFRPAEAAVEQTFVNKDGVATLKLGQARGVAMLAPATLSPSQLRMRITAALRQCGSRWSAYDRQAQGADRFLRRGFRHPRCRRRRLSGALLLTHLAGSARGGRGGRAVDRDLCSRRPD